MIKLFVLDVPEFRPFIDEARHRVQSARVVGDYVELANDTSFEVDRDRAGVRRAVWFSAIAALAGGTVARFDSYVVRIDVAPMSGVDLTGEEGGRRVVPR